MLRRPRESVPVQGCIAADSSLSKVWSHMRKVKCPDSKARCPQIKLRYILLLYTRASKANTPEFHILDDRVRVPSRTFDWSGTVDTFITRIRSRNPTGQSFTRFAFVNLKPPTAGYVYHAWLTHRGVRYLQYDITSHIVQDNSVADQDTQVAT